MIGVGVGIQVAAEMSGARTGNCDYCGLPLPRSWRARKEPKNGADATSSVTSSPAYCCAGCSLAAAVAEDQGEVGALRWMLARLGLAIFFTMNVLVFSMTLWTTEMYGRGSESPSGTESSSTQSQASTSADADADARAVSDVDVGANKQSVLQDLYRYLCLLFSLPVLFLLWPMLWENAWAQLRRGIPSTDVLLALGVLAAYAVSGYSVAVSGGGVYFEVGCVVLVMVTLGRWLEATGKHKTSAALDALEALLPADVARLDPPDDHITTVPRDAIRPGDRFRLTAGERFPADGVIVRGTASVDEQILTGESWPKSMGPGDRVLAGTLDLDGDLIVAVTAIAGDAALGKLITAVRNARLARGRYEILAERVSRFFLPVVLIIAICAFAYHGVTQGAEAGLLVGLSVILIACPCALGVATPMAVWTALGAAARFQVLFRSGETLERLAGIRALRLDKTGTLTTGKAEVLCLTTVPGLTQDQVRYISGFLASSSPHILARAILDDIGAHPQERSQIAEDAAPVTVIRARVRPGRGVLADLSATEPLSAMMGNLALFQEEGWVIPEALTAALAEADERGTSVALVGWSGAACGVYQFQERLRPEAVELLAGCRSRGWDVAVLTGDRRARGDALARELGVPVLSELLPDAKVAAIRQARDTIGPTVMVGDGINDAPALEASDVGIAMGCGADITRGSAQVCLLGDDLRKILWSVDLARRTTRVIRQNLLWAFGYNAIGVLWAACGYLNPAFAALLMVVSSVLVILNSLRLNERPPTSAAAPVVTAHESRIAEPA